MEYNSPVWSPYLKKDIEKLESIQRSFTKAACLRCSIPFSSYKDRLYKLNLKSLEYRRVVTDLIFLFKIIRGETNLDFSNFFLHKKLPFTPWASQRGGGGGGGSWPPQNLIWGGPNTFGPPKILNYSYPRASKNRKILDWYLNFTFYIQLTLFNRKKFGSLRSPLFISSVFTLFPPFSGTFSSNISIFWGIKTQNVLAPSSTNTNVTPLNKSKHPTRNTSFRQQHDLRWERSLMQVWFLIWGL